MPVRELDLAMKPEAASLEAWETVARKALGGRPPSELATAIADGIALRALGTRRDWPLADASGAPGLPPFTRGARAPADVRWDIRQIQTKSDPAAANAELLADLAGGATSAWLKLGAMRAGGQTVPANRDGIVIRTPNDIERVLAGVSLETPVAFDAGISALRIAESMLDGASGRALFVNHDVFGAAAACGAMAGSFARELRAAASLARRVDQAGGRLCGIDTRPYHNAGATPAQELGIAAASGIAYVRALTGIGLDLNACGRQIAFIMVTDPDLLVSAAKLRAMRRIWGRILEACGAPEATKELHLTAVTSEAMLTRRSAHTNILRTTVAALAAALGGADAISVTPFDARLGPPTAHSRRIARNIQSILMEESHVARVADPLGGSFSGECLSEDLAVAAWKFFQEIELQGGMAAALKNGFIRERIDEAWQRRRRRFAWRNERITGVSDFPVLAENSFSTAEPPPEEEAQAKAGFEPAVPPMHVMSPLPLRHLDDDFETLRLASEAHEAEVGEKPKLALICMGAESEFGPREAFARTLFESGGIQAILIQSSDAETAAAAFLDSGIRIAALVSSDAAYAEHGLAFAHEVKRAGARYLYLIGLPGELEVAFLDAGIDEFVPNEFDAIGLLRRAHMVLGMSA